MALGRGGAVLTWGDNQRGQCGRHPEMPLLPRPGRAVLPLLEGEVAVQVAAGGYRSAVISSTGRLLVLGLTEVDLTAEDMEMEPGGGYPYAGEGGAEPDWEGLAATRPRRVQHLLSDQVACCRREAWLSVLQTWWEVHFPGLALADRARALRHARNPAMRRVQHHPILRPQILLHTQCLHVRSLRDVPREDSPRIPSDFAYLTLFTAAGSIPHCVVGASVVPSASVGARAAELAREG